MAHTPTIATPKEADPVQGTGTTADKWNSWVAVTTAILAALASIASLLSGIHADEGMMDQVEVSDQWNYYQAKGIKAAVLESKVDLLPALGKQPDPEDVKRIARYADEQATIRAQADKTQASAKDHRARRAIMSRAVSGFQIGIALCAIGLLTKRRPFWYVAILCGVVGTVFLVQGLLPASTPASGPPPAAPAAQPATPGSSPAPR
jgi:hypothetical protein